MKKTSNFSFLVLLFFSTFLAKAQEGNLKIGPNLSGARNIIDFNLHDNELSVISNQGYNLNYWKLSPVSLIPNGESKSISAPKSKSGGVVVNSDEYIYFDKISLNNKEMVFYKKNDTKNKTASLYYQDLNNSYKPLTKAGKLASRSTKAAKSGLFNMFSTDGGGYTIRTNRNKDRVLIINQAPAKKVDKTTVPGEVTLSLYDPKDMSELANATYDLEISSYGSSAVVGDDGYVYSLVHVSPESRAERKDKKNRGEASWFYKIIGVNLNNPEAEPFEYNLIFKNKGILKATLEITNNGELICAGTYSELTKKGNIDDFDGIFYAKLDPKTGEVISDNQRKLDRATVEFMTSKKNAKKNEGVSTSFKLRGYEAMDNNTSNLILEEDYWYVVTTYSGRGQTTTTYHYISKAILVANIASDGEINWISHIPKFQHTVNDEGAFNSFTYFKDKNELNFVFADNSNNYDDKTFALKKENAKNINDMRSSKQAKSLALAKLDEKGKVDQKLIASSKKHVLYTRYGTWSKSGKELYMQAWKRINAGQYLLGCLFPPYGCYLLVKRLKPSYAVARLEIE
jgi:hypothetical protein